jgi:hypothetical protein
MYGDHSQRRLDIIDDYRHGTPHLAGHSQNNILMTSSENPAMYFFLLIYHNEQLTSGAGRTQCCTYCMRNAVRRARERAAQDTFTWAAVNNLYATAYVNICPPRSRRHKYAECRRTRKWLGNLALFKVCHVVHIWYRKPF